jgi:hypothetical protein
MGRRPALQSSANRRHGLMLVSAAPEIDAGAFERGRFDGPPPLARPSDRLEPWLLESGPSLIAFADAAYQLGVPFQTAVSVVLERQLLGEALARNGMATVVADLDAQAQVSTVECELSDGLAAYVRVLSPRSRDFERLGGSDSIVARLDSRLLDSALAWERAAALRGLTMTEWAGLAALSASR